MNMAGKTLLEDVKERGKQRTKREEHVLLSTARFALLRGRWERGGTRCCPAPVSAPLVCRAPAPGQASAHLGLAKYHKNKNQGYHNLRASFVFSLHIC